MQKLQYYDSVTYIYTCRFQVILVKSTYRYLCKLVNWSPCDLRLSIATVLSCCFQRFMWISLFSLYLH